MNSFAFWYEKQKESKNDLRAHVHFNLFCEYSNNKGKNNPILDVGFLISNISSAKHLFFFLPVENSGGEDSLVIEDLGSKLVKGKVLEALFNEPFLNIESPDNKFFLAKKQYNEGDQFAVYYLDIKEDISIEDISFSQDNDIVKGTKISIDTKNLIKASAACKNNCYIRFRIRGSSFNGLVREYHLPFYALQSVLHTTHMVDFRYNNTRSLPPKLVEQMRSNYCDIVTVSSLHFLFITKAYVDVLGNSFPRARAIEPHVWKPYLDNCIDDKDTLDMVAYYFVDKNEQGAYEKNGMYPSDFFIKYQVEKSVAWFYILITIALGAVGSVVASLFKYFLSLVGG